MIYVAVFSLLAFLAVIYCMMLLLKTKVKKNMAQQKVIKAQKRTLSAVTKRFLKVAAQGNQEYLKLPPEERKSYFLGINPLQTIRDSEEGKIPKLKLGEVLKLLK